ncbi:MAG: ATP-binding cassette domain-containing protein, partial [Betaproteobacteria bacterium]|nr:ATP-binding cassette domain-containing protein [Betaproteobacteria bacterium]
MIEINNLTVQFGGVKPINELTVTLKCGISGLIGPNGAGKTTLLNVLSGFVTPTQGSVSVNGRKLTGLAPHKRALFGLRRTFQTDQIADDLTLWENVEAIADHAGFIDKDMSDHAVSQAIDYVGLSKRIHRKGSNLSTQERHLA